MATNTESENLIEEAESIIRSQGNIFIKELLRSKKKTDSSIKIGVSKDDTLENLVSAIRDGKISRDDLHSWINEVEGWGKQHVYLFTVSNQLSQDAIWSSTDTIQKKLRTIGLSKSWKAGNTFAFPDNLDLAGTDFDGERFECIWRRGVPSLEREEEKDPPSQVLDGDTYEFHAYRQTAIRSVMRFDLYPKRSEAALFIQTPLGPDHTAAKSGAFETLRKIFDTTLLKPVKISKAIKTLDQSELDAKDDTQTRVRAQNTKFESRGATVEFAADPAIQAWKTVTAVRQVRRALRTADFEGDRGKFVIKLGTKDGMKREVTMSMSGGDKRVYFHAQMTAEEVAEVLTTVRSSAR